VGSKLHEDCAEAVKLARAAAKRIDFFMRRFNLKANLDPPCFLNVSAALSLCCEQVTPVLPVCYGRVKPSCSA
jgi:hypothetical protein